MPSNVILMRLLLALALMAGGVMLYMLVNRALIFRARKIKPLVPGYRPGIPAILYFTTPQCLPCKTIQRPALARLKESLGDRLNIIEVNAQEQPNLAKQWGVLSVPTTFIIDAKGELKHINHGVTRAEKLFEQLAETDYEI